MVCQNCGCVLESWYCFCPQCGAEPGKAAPNVCGLTLRGAYAKMWKNFAVFRGRASRREYWYTYLMQSILLFAGVLGATLPLVIALIVGDEGGALQLCAGGIAAVSFLYMLVMAIPMIALSVRRLHDTGKSGWWYLVNWVPYVGSIAIIVLLALEGERCENKYGPKPEE